MHILSFLLLLFNAQIYKCIVGDEIIYSQTDCGDSEEVLIEEHRYDSAYEENMAQIKAGVAQTLNELDNKKTRSNLRSGYQSSINALDWEIRRNQQKIWHHFSGGANRAESSIIAGLEAKNGKLIAERSRLVAESRAALIEMKREQEQ